MWDSQVTSRHVTSRHITSHIVAPYCYSISKNLHIKPHSFLLISLLGYVTFSYMAEPRLHILLDHHLTLTIASVYSNTASYSTLLYIQNNIWRLPRRIVFTLQSESELYYCAWLQHATLQCVWNRMRVNNSRWSCSVSTAVIIHYWSNTFRDFALLRCGMSEKLQFYSWVVLCICNDFKHL